MLLIWTQNYTHMTVSIPHSKYAADLPVIDSTLKTAYVSKLPPVNF